MPPISIDRFGGGLGVQGTAMEIRSYKAVRQLQPMEYLEIVFAGIAEDDEIIFRASNNMEGVSISPYSNDLCHFLRENSTARLSLTTKEGFVFGFCLRAKDGPLPDIRPSFLLAGSLHYGAVYLFDEPIHIDDAVGIGLAAHVDLDNPAPIAGMSKITRRWADDCGSTHSLAAVIAALDKHEKQKKELEAAAKAANVAAKAAKVAAKAAKAIALPVAANV